MQIKITLNDVEYMNPFGVDGLQVILERDKTLKGLIVKYTNKFEFVGEAYVYLYNLSLSSSFTTLVRCNIYTKNNINDPWYLEMKGIINMSDVVFSLYPIKKAAATVEDDSFATYITNNKSIETSLTAGRSKQDESITACTLVNIDFFNSVSGLYTTSPYMIRVFDAFQYLVKFMTDGYCDFESEVFGTGGEYEFLYLTLGSNIRDDSRQDVPIISFWKLFKEVDAKRNLAVVIDRTTETPIVKIIYESNLYKDEISHTFENPEDAEKSFDRSRLYSRVRIGSKNFLNYDSAEKNFVNWQFVSFNEEEYFVAGQNNLDILLDLTTDWIVDHNIINSILTLSIEDYDENIFLVMANSSAEAIQYGPYNVGGAVFYNLLFTNNNICINYQNAIPNSIVDYLGSPTTDFHSELTSNLPIASGVLIFDNETVDIGTNYDNATGEYEIPSDGVYSFTTLMKVNVENILVYDLPTPTLVATIYFRRYDSSMTLIEERLAFEIYSTAFVGFNFFASTAIYCNATDIITLEADVVYNYLSVSIDAYGSNSFFESKANYASGGLWHSFDFNKIPLIKYNFAESFAFATLRTIMANETKRINFTLQNDTFGGWIQRMVLNLTKSTTDVELIERNQNLIS